MSAAAPDEGRLAEILGRVATARRHYGDMLDELDEAIEAGNRLRPRVSLERLAEAAGRAWMRTFSGKDAETWDDDQAFKEIARAVCREAGVPMEGRSDG